MALFGIGGDRALFGGSQPAAGQQAAPPSAPTSTALMAEQTGATASSPFLQYLQQNAPAAKQTAAALMGEKPEADYSDAWLQAGMAMMSQGGGQNFLQALGNAGQTAMPMIQKERERVRGHNDKINNLAAQLNMSAAEFDSKVSDEDPFKEMGGNVVDSRKLKQLIDSGAEPSEAFQESIILPKKYETEQTSEALATTRMELERLKGRPDADPEQLSWLQDKIDALEADIFPQKESKTGFVPVVTSDGRMAMVAADSDQLGGILKQFGSEKEMAKIKEKRQSASNAAGFTARLLELTSDAPAGSTGRLGGLASSAAAWSDLLLDKMPGPAKKQFTTEVQGRPLERLDEMYQDPEARAWLDDGLYDKLREVGQRDAQILSNVLGLGYATAKSADEGGRLSDSDVALNLSRLGYDLDAWLNDPSRLRAGLLDTLRSNVGQYRTELMFTADSPEQAEQLVQKDILLNKVLPEMGFGWDGGVDGDLVYRPKGSRPAEGEQGQGGQPGPQREPAPGPSPQPQGGPQKPISQMTIEDLNAVDRTQMTDEELQEAARRYNELSQGAQ